MQRLLARLVELGDLCTVPGCATFHLSEQTGVLQTLHQADLDVGRHGLLFILKPVTRTDLDQLAARVAVGIAPFRRAVPGQLRLVGERRGPGGGKHILDHVGGDPEPRRAADE